MEQSRLEPVAVRCTATDDAQRLGASVYFPHRLEVLGDSRPFDMRLKAVSYGPVTVGMLSYSDPVHIETDDMETAYEVNIPLAGSVECWSGSDQVVASPQRAVLFRPYGVTSMRGFGQEKPLLGVKVDRSALEAQLSDLVGSKVSGPISLSSALDLTAGRGREWWAVARSVTDLFSAVDDGAALLNNALVMRPLMQSLLTGLLFAAEHPHLAHVLEPPSAAVPAVVRCAQDFIEDHADEALTVSDIASQVGMSIRGLQVSFQRHLQTTPMEYLRDVRLRHAHAELITADPDRTTIAEIAYRWGFGHLGRFAAHHRATYGTTPSEALGSAL
ncbi:MULTISPECIES: AraC family transcriptional regulator [Prauserella salsuginis group]|uniref:AraC family transcriptional regulator n=1 Tax=Prauserella salsuginis TaxID=387889 RepID=A0ABW6G0M3_9PSEU|nr:MULTISPECIES: AraC family transcriptional regulator [Prauserella salsuginis group]MCR3721913.1 AraC-type DNA-binding protein [Prauserella flava]MCR3735918.1 AraC-type DNA-binding protein [Prauserella salsuginis]